jgi:hypothetical protein
MPSNLGGMARWGLGGGRVRMDARWTEALSGVVVSSMAGMTKIMQRFILKVARWF